uniref:hypothetical protein n=1 Tax=Trichocoleus desertorum TaxID=1481672 RepID=UPI0025B4E292|nr:hypothetical protein [Trichocoleus desertorum]
MFEILILVSVIALTFTAVVCWILYALVGEMGWIKPAPRRLARKRMVRHGLLLLCALSLGAALLSHGVSLLSAILIAGGLALVIEIIITNPTPSASSSSGVSASSSTRGYETVEAPPFERYAGSLPGLKNQLIGMLQGDRRAAHSMVLYEKNVLPGGHPEAWYWKAAIQRLERDRRW